MMIGKIVHRLRTEKGLSLQKLADAAGLSKGHICDLEKCKETNPTIGSLYAIAAALDTDISTLLSVPSRAEAIGARTNYHIVFDGFPAPDGPRFVELENDAGRSISAGEWNRRADGLTELVIPTVRDEELRKAVRSVIASLKADYSYDDDGYGTAERLERALLQQEGE